MRGKRAGAGGSHLAVRFLCVLQSGTFNPHSRKKPALSPSPARGRADGTVLTSLSPRRAEDALRSKDAPFQILLRKTGTETLRAAITVYFLDQLWFLFFFFLFCLLVRLGEDRFEEDMCGRFVLDVQFIT